MRGPKNVRNTRPAARGPAHPLAARRAAEAAESEEKPTPVRKIDGRSRGFAHLQAGRTATAKPARPAPVPQKPGSQSPEPEREPKERGPKERPKDGEGRPYITLAQLLKMAKVAESGGEAKHRVRQGGITVNGQPEDRPGRKLHAGDTVSIDGDEMTVDLG